MFPFFTYLPNLPSPSPSPAAALLGLSSYLSWTVHSLRTLSNLAFFQTAFCQHARVSRIRTHQVMSLLWTECLCPFQTHMLKPSSPLSWCLEMGPWEITRSWGWRHHDRTSVLRHWKRWGRVCFLSLGEGTMRRQSANKEAGSHQTLDLLAPWSPTSPASRTVGKKCLFESSSPWYFCYSSPN